MNHHKIFLTNSNDSNKYFHSIPISTDYLISSKLKRNHITNLSPFIFNSNTHSKNKNPALKYLTSKNISHRDFHINVHIQEYKNKSLINKSKKNYTKKENFYNINRVGKDLDFMKIQMSCDLIAHKINRIKNKVQNLHESNIQDDKLILSAKNKRLHNKEKFNLNKRNNTFIDNYSQYNYSIKRFQNINDSNIYNNSFNSNLNIGENYINYFRKINSYNIPNVNINQNRKFISNKNALKYVLLNSANSKNNDSKITIPFNTKNAYFNLNNSYLLTEKEINNNSTNNNLELLKNRIIQSYQNKKNIILTAPIQNKKILKHNSYNRKNLNNINSGNMRRNDKKKLQETSFSSNPVKYGSFDKYFFNNNRNDRKIYKNSNYSNRILYNHKYNLNIEGKILLKKDNKDKNKQLQKINKMINKNNIAVRGENNFNILKNKNKIKEIIDKNYKLNYNRINHKDEPHYMNLKQILKPNKISSINNELEVNKGINNFNYYLNKEGNVVQNNFINNNFNLKNGINNQTKKNKKPVLFDKKVGENKNKQLINPILKYNNTKIKRKEEEEEKYDKNNTFNYKNLNSNNIKNNFNFSIGNNYLNNKKRNNIFNKNKIDNNININCESKKEERFTLHNNYSKDDILRNSVKYNINNKSEGNNRSSELKEENIFDLMIQEEKSDENLNKNEKNFKINIISKNEKENEQYKKININKGFKNIIDKNLFENNEHKYKLNKIPNINIRKIIKYKERKVRPRHKELCYKFASNPQHFFTEKINELMLKALNLKKK